MHTQIKLKKYEYNNNNHTDEIKKGEKAPRSCDDEIVFYYYLHSRDSHRSMMPFECAIGSKSHIRDSCTDGFLH